MIRKTFHIILLAAVLGLFSVGDLMAQTVPVTPEIKFLSSYPASLKAFSDSLTIAIAYADGDGDLGENDPSVKNLFVVDSRNGVEYAYRLQKLFSKSEKAAIKGKLNVVVDAAFLMDPDANEEQVSYTVYLKDRAGNESNRVETGPITIHR